MPRIAHSLVVIAAFCAATAVALYTATPTRAADPVYLGDQPGNRAVADKLRGELRRLPAPERKALMEVTLLCELDKPTLSRLEVYAPWEKRCLTTEAAWTTAFRTPAAFPAVAAQMKIYLDRRARLTRTAADYFAARDAIDRKRQKRENIRQDVTAAVLLRKDISIISGEMLKFFFALRDLADEARK